MQYLTVEIISFGRYGLRVEKYCVLRGVMSSIRSRNLSLAVSYPHYDTAKYRIVTWSDKYDVEGEEKERRNEERR
jgi:hypothetical protein